MNGTEASPRPNYGLHKPLQGKRSVLPSDSHRNYAGRSCAIPLKAIHGERPIKLYRGRSARGPVEGLRAGKL